MLTSLLISLLTVTTPPAFSDIADGYYCAHSTLSVGDSFPTPTGFTDTVSIAKITDGSADVGWLYLMRNGAVVAQANARMSLVMQHQLDLPVEHFRVSRYRVYPAHHPLPVVTAPCRISDLKRTPYVRTTP